MSNKLNILTSIVSSVDYHPYVLSKLIFPLLPPVFSKRKEFHDLPLLLPIVGFTNSEPCPLPMGSSLQIHSDALTCYLLVLAPRNVSKCGGDIDHISVPACVSITGETSRPRFNQFRRATP